MSGPRDVLIDIAYAGICHSDIDHAHSVRGKTMYPLVPGHEIAGHRVGGRVARSRSSRWATAPASATWSTPAGSATTAAPDSSSTAAAGAS